MRYSKCWVNSGDMPAFGLPTGATRTWAHAGAAGGVRCCHAIGAAEGRDAASSATACAFASPRCVIDERATVSELPERRISTEMSAGSDATGAKSSAVSERSLRTGSATRCSIARIIEATQSPPYAPRPWRQPSCTSRRNWSPDAIGVETSLSDMP